MSLNGVQDSLELQQELCGHTDRVWSVAWSPAGDMLASCSGDKTVRIWAKAANSETWACTAVLEGGHTRTVRACSWSPDGQCLATASFDATVVIWQREGNDFENVAILEGHENEVKCVAWSPSGTLIATCSRDKSVWIWECEPGHEYFCLDVKHGHSQACGCNAILLSSDAKCQPEHPHNIEAAVQDVKSVCWHPSGELLVSCSYDDSIKLWTDDGGEWICTQTLEGAGVGHSSTVWAIAFSPDSGSKMISCSDDSTLRIWECHFARGFREPKFKHLATISGHHDRAIYSVDWSQDGLIATGSQDNSISIFRVGERLGPEAELGSNLSTELVMQKPQAHEADVNCVRWHPRQHHLLASASDDNCIRLWSYMGRTNA